MTTCSHTTIVLLPERKNILRCLHCHLTIRAEELGGSYCPECYEADGNKKYDFEKTETKEPETDRYRCENCGAIIESEKQ
ncbi:MAG: hypothetical protein ABFR82_14095 [Nitrospirota bacterium]